MNRVQAANRLAKLGWGFGVTKDAKKLDRAIADFQRAWNLGQHVEYQGVDLGRLYIDGRLGPRTSLAIEFSQQRRLEGKPTASNNFSFTELACKGSVVHKGCARIRCHAQLLHGLELMRRLQGPMSLASVYRCQTHNANVGGASSSQHVYGAGSDVTPELTFLQVARLGVFSGIGVQRATGKVRHVDVRHLSGNNTTGGTPARPTKWYYG